MSTMRKLLEIASQLDWIAVTVTRIGLVVVFVWIGALKAFDYQDEGIVPLVANSPFMNFLYRQPAREYREHMNQAGEVVPANREWHTQNRSYTVGYALGVAIVGFGVMIALHPWLPAVSAVGSLMVAMMSLVTLSFVVTTPECWVPSLGSPVHGFPFLSGVGAAIVKDVVLMGAGLVTMVDSAKAYLRTSISTAQKTSSTQLVSAAV